MDVDMNLIGAAAGFAGARALLAEYRLWKANRTEVPMDLNPATGFYEPDYRLKRTERRMRLFGWLFCAVSVVLGTAALMNYPAVH